MYPTILTLHSYARWIVVALGVWAIVSVLPSRLGRSSRTSPLPGLLFSIGLDVQMLIGVLLYVALSPLTAAAMQDMGGAMRNGGLRFWAVEHPVLMILAVVFGHLGRPGRGSRDVGRRAMLWFGLALLAILLATPWPFMPQGRPWVRW